MGAHPEGEDPPEVRHRADRVGELLQPCCPHGTGVLPEQQVLGGVPGAAVLRRHRDHRQDRAALSEEGAGRIQAQPRFYPVP